MTISEKVEHLKGFLEGMNFAADTNENKVILSIVDILDDLSHEVENLADDVDTLNDYADELDHDLGELEEYVYDDGECDCCDDDDCDCCDDECGCECECYEAECPNCHEKICFDDSIDPNDIICPNCQGHFKFDPEQN